MFKQDYIMRQIEMLVQFFARALFGKDKVEYAVADYTAMSDMDRLYEKVMRLFRARDICGAEDALFSGAEGNARDHILLGLDFYGRLNEMSDAELENANFSREEISDGLKEYMKLFSIEIPE